MRGRKPKPIEQHIANGDPSKLGTGKLQERLDQQVKAKRGLPNAPGYLSKVGRAAWYYWRDELESMALDYAPDRMMLEGACVNYARALQAEDEIQSRGINVVEPVMNSEGEEVGERVKQNPAVAIANQAWRLVHRFCSEFGLSPVARTRLSIKDDPRDPEEDLEKILREPRTPRVKPPENVN
jgi:P27 family predicted phage terminase small subunit